MLSLVSMRHQLDRKPLHLTHSPHEKRFQSMAQIPPVCTKYIRCSVPDMAKGLPRGSIAVGTSSPSYDPNKEAVMQRVWRKLEFAKMRQRAPLFAGSPFRSEANEIGYTQVEPKVISRDFSKMQPRDKNPSLPLPTFMQDATSRVSLEHLTEKTIKMNCTRDSLLSPKLSPGEMLRLINRSHRSSSMLSFL